VVFDLVIEAAHDPSEHRYPTLDVDGGAQLMQHAAFAAPRCSGTANSTLSTQWASWKTTARVTPTDPRADQVATDRHPPWMEQQRDPERPAQVGQLARQHQGQIATSGSSPQRLLADAPVDEVGEVAVGQPLDRQEALHKPQVQVLVLVSSPPRLAGGNAGEWRLADVAVDADHVGVAMVEVAAREPPQPRTGTEQISAVREHAVQPGRAVNAPWFESCICWLAATTATNKCRGADHSETHAPVTDDETPVRGEGRRAEHQRLALRSPPRLEISAMVGMINWVNVDSALAPADVRVPAVTVD
jgi:hypothetical protein